MADLINAGSGQKAQMFKLQEGLIHLTSGTYKGVDSLECVADGDVVLTFRTGNTKTVSCVEGNNFSFEIDSIEILSGGEFHLMATQ